MIPSHLLPLEVEWVQPGSTTNSYGDTVADWSDDAVTTATIAVMIEHRRADEELDGRTATITTLVMFTNELAVAATDRIVWAGVTYEVDGDPAIVHTPRGPHHLEGALRRVEG